MGKLTADEQATADKLVAEYEADMARIRPLNDFEKAVVDRVFGPDSSHFGASLQRQTDAQADDPRQDCSGLSL
jgi:hypothetical protein